MKEITMKSMLVWYGLAVVVFVVTLMSIAQEIVTTPIGAIVSLVLIPLVSAMISVKLAIGKKKVRTADEYKRTVLITNIVSFAIAYWFVFAVDLIQILIYAVGVIFAHLYSKKKIEQSVMNDKADVKTEPSVTANVNANVAPTVTDLGKDNEIIKQYKLETFNDAGIREFLTMNHLNADNYVFATLIPGMTSTLLYGSLASLGMTNYIITFDNEKIYMFELSKLSNKVIEDCMIIDVKTIKEIKMKTVVFGIARRATIGFDNKERITLQMNKKVMGLKEQTETINRFASLVS